MNATQQIGMAMLIVAAANLMACAGETEPSAEASAQQKTETARSCLSREESENSWGSATCNNGGAKYLAGQQTKIGGALNTCTSKGWSPLPLCENTTPRCFVPKHRGVTNPVLTCGSLDIYCLPASNVPQPDRWDYHECGAYGWN
jgi:hypothetical protein